MRTIILRMDAPAPTGDGFPVSVNEWTLESGFTQPPLLTAHLPADLQAPNLAKNFTLQEMQAALAGAIGEEPALIDIGQQLFYLLVQCGAAPLLFQPQEDQRVILDIRSPDLQSLPWELLINETRVSLFTSPAKHLFLCRGNFDTLQSLPALEWPLRLMVVIGSAPGDKAVKGEDELSKIIGALTSCDPHIDLYVWKRRSKANLVAEMKRFNPHILHFIGHGSEIGNAGEVCLELTNESGIIEPWEPDAIRNDEFPDNLRLVFINACRSSSADRAGLYSITGAFLDAGAPAVIGMRSDVSGEDVGRFSASFYAALAEGKAVDQAVAIGRRAVLSRHPDGLRRREWAAPCLEVRRPPDDILVIGASDRIVAAKRDLVRKEREFVENRILVDRRIERRDLWQALAADERSILVITGDDMVGKSSFGRLLMERCFISGHDVHYINLDLYIKADWLHRRGDFLTLLRAIRDGNPSSNRYLGNPLPASAFSAFNNLINEILQTPAPPGQEGIDQMGMVNSSAMNRAEEILLSFHESLEKSISSPPLVLFLDELATLNNYEFSNLIVPYLLKWCSARKDVRIVLLMTNNLFKRFEVEKLKGCYYELEVTSFSEDQWKELALEYIIRGIPGREFSDQNAEDTFFGKANEWIQQALSDKKIQGQWKPVKLKEILVDG